MEYKHIESNIVNLYQTSECNFWRIKLSEFSKVKKNPLIFRNFSDFNK